MYYVLILSHCGEVCCGVLATLLGHKCIISHWPQLILAKVDRFQLSCMTVLRRGAVPGPPPIVHQDATTHTI